VLPDGFVVELGPLAEPAVLPVELPAPLIVVPLEPPVPAPALLPLDPAAEPPAAPPAPPPACASANVLERAKAVANAIVVIRMVVPLGCRCSSNDNLHLMFRRPEFDWIVSQKSGASRPKAIRLLVELGEKAKWQ
jgi:hypothetical protein